MARTALSCCLGLVVAWSAFAAAPPVRDHNLELLCDGGLATDTPALIRYLRECTPKDSDLGRAGAVIPLLGDDRFAAREDAGRRLVALGLSAVPALRRALRDPEAEVRKRAGSCLAAIARRTIPYPHIPHKVTPLTPLPDEHTWPAPATYIVAALGVLRVRGAREAAAPMLAYLPSADEHEGEQIYHALVEFTEGGVPQCLTSGISSPLWQRRAALAIAVGRNGNEKQRRAVRGLLRDAVPEVRLRAAQGLLAGGDTSGVAALVGLLEGTSLPIAWQAEELLRYAAGASAPREVLAEATAARRKACRAAWEGRLGKAWAKAFPDQDLPRHQRPALVLAVEITPVWKPGVDGKDPWRGPLRETVWLCGGDGQPRAKAFTTVAEAVQIFPRADNRRVAEHCSICTEWLFERGLLVGSPWEGVRKVNVDSGVVSAHVARQGSGNDLSVARWRIWFDMSGLIEVDSQGRTVWEAWFESRTAGLVVCPLVRVGFPPRGSAVLDLHSEAERVRALKHPDVLVRRNAITRLEHRPQTRSLSRAVEVALDDEDDVVLSTAVRMVGFGGEADDTSIPKLVKLLEKEKVERRAGILLVRCGEAGVKALVAAFNDKQGPNASRRRAAAARAVARSDRIYPQLGGPVLRAAATDSDVKVRVAVCDGFYWGNTALERYKSEIVGLLTDRQDEVVNAACIAVLSVRVPRGVPTECQKPLLAALRRPGTRCNAIIAIAVAGGDTALDTVIEQDRRHGDPNVRLSVSVALKLLATRENAGKVVPILQSYLGDLREVSNGGPSVQGMAIEALEAIGPLAKHAVPALMRLAKGTKDPNHEPAKSILRALDRIDAAAKKELLTFFDQQF